MGDYRRGEVSIDGETWMVVPETALPDDYPHWRVRDADGKIINSGRRQEAIPRLLACPYWADGEHCYLAILGDYLTSESGVTALLRGQDPPQMTKRCACGSAVERKP